MPISLTWSNRADKPIQASKLRSATLGSLREGCTPSWFKKKLAERKRAMRQHLGQYPHISYCGFNKSSHWKNQVTRCLFYQWPYPQQRSRRRPQYFENFGRCQCHHQRFFYRWRPFLHSFYWIHLYPNRMWQLRLLQDNVFVSISLKANLVWLSGSVTLCYT